MSCLRLPTYSQAVCVKNGQHLRRSRPLAPVQERTTVLATYAASVQTVVLAGGTTHINNLIGESGTGKEL